MSKTEPQHDECHVCGETVLVDGEHATERFGETVCRDCAGEPVAFRATCSSGLCEWSFRVAETEFNRGHAKIRAQQEANAHERFKRVFEDDPMHKTTVSEVDSDE